MDPVESARRGFGLVLAPGKTSKGEDEIVAQRIAAMRKLAERLLAHNEAVFFSGTQFRSLLDEDSGDSPPVRRKGGAGVTNKAARSGGMSSQVEQQTQQHPVQAQQIQTPQSSVPSQLHATPMQQSCPTPTIPQTHSTAHGGGNSPMISTSPGFFATGGPGGTTSTTSSLGNYPLHPEQSARGDAHGRPTVTAHFGKQPSLPYLPNAPSSLFEWSDQRLSTGLFSRKRELGFEPIPSNSKQNVTGSPYIPFIYPSVGGLAAVHQHHHPDMQVTRSKKDIAEDDGIQSSGDYDHCGDGEGANFTEGAAYENETVHGSPLLIRLLQEEAIAVSRGGLYVFEDQWDDFDPGYASDITGVVSLGSGHHGGVAHANSKCFKSMTVLDNGLGRSEDSMEVEGANGDGSPAEDGSCSPRLIVGYDDEWISIPPQILPEWEFAHLEPVSKFFAVNEFSVVEVSNEVNEEDRAPAKSSMFFKELCGMFDVYNFGILTRKERNLPTYSIWSILERDIDILAEAASELLRVPGSSSGASGHTPTSAGGMTPNLASSASIGGVAGGSSSSMNSSSVGTSGIVTSAAVGASGTTLRSTDSGFSLAIAQGGFGNGGMTEVSESLRIAKEFLDSRGVNSGWIVGGAQGTQGYGDPLMDDISIDELKSFSLSDNASGPNRVEGFESKTFFFVLPPGGKRYSLLLFDALCGLQSRLDGLKNSKMSGSHGQIDGGGSLGQPPEEWKNRLRSDLEGSALVVAGALNTQRIMFQLVPCDQVQLVERRESLQQLSWSLYSKSASSNNQLGTPVMAESKESECIHVCYTFSQPTKEWLCVCWTDQHGLVLETAVLPTKHPRRELSWAKYVEKLLRLVVWERTLQLMGRLHIVLGTGDPFKRICVSLLHEPLEFEKRVFEECWKARKETVGDLGSFLLVRLVFGCTRLPEEILRGEQNEFEVVCSTCESCVVVVDGAPLESDPSQVAVFRAREVCRLNADEGVGLDLDRVVRDLQVLSSLRIHAQSGVVPLHVHVASLLGHWFSQICISPSHFS